MSHSPRAHLIDASIYIFHAWQRLPDTLHDTAGRPAQAVQGFADVLFRLLDGNHPSHVALAYDDPQTESWRRALFADYKANRPPRPADLDRQYTACRELADDLGLRGFGSSSHEADDLIGTLATRLRAAGFAITILTADKDLAQLLREGDRWWNFHRNQVLDEKGVERLFGVPPRQIADLLAIAGDKSDNIPGVPGIGFRTAAKLLRKHHSLDGLLANLDQVHKMRFKYAGYVEAELKRHVDTMRLAIQLTTIDCDAPLPEPLDITWKPDTPDAALRRLEQAGIPAKRLAEWEELLEQACRG